MPLEFVWHTIKSALVSTALDSTNRHQCRVGKLEGNETKSI
jgi:hypothetical protein